MDKKGPEKKERLLLALDKGMAMVHLDARRPGVLVPAELKSEAHLRLNLSFRFDPPDLTVGEWGVRCTLSFSGSRFTVGIPWSALFAITSQISNEFWMYPDDMPAELIQTSVIAAQSSPPDQPGSARALLREVVLDGQDREPSEAAEDAPRPISRNHLRVVK